MYNRISKGKFRCSKNFDEEKLSVSSDSARKVARESGRFIHDKSEVTLTSRADLKAQKATTEGLAFKGRDVATSRMITNNASQQIKIFELEEKLQI